jgi:hypothetical protein
MPSALVGVSHLSNSAKLAHWFPVTTGTNAHLGVLNARDVSSKF